MSLKDINTNLWPINNRQNLVILCTKHVTVVRQSLIPPPPPISKEKQAVWPRETNFLPLILLTIDICINCQHHHYTLTYITYLIFQLACCQVLLNKLYTHVSPNIVPLAASPPNITTSCILAMNPMAWNLLAGGSSAEALSGSISLHVNEPALA